MKKALKILLVLVVLAVVGLVAFVQLAPETALRYAVQGERDRSGLVKRELLLPATAATATAAATEAERVVYLDGGEGPPLLLLHGFGADKDNFTRFARWLTPHYRVYAPDLVGYGESAKPPAGDYAPRAQVERLRAFARGLGLGGTPLHLGGSSMGGHIAMEWAAAYPNEVASLLLLDPGGAWRSGSKSELTKRLEAGGPNPLIARTPDEFAAVFRFVMAKPPYVPRAMLDAMARQRLDAGSLALAERQFAQLRASPVEERVRGLATPTLIVWGAEDRAISADTAPVLKALMPRAEVIVLPGIGHLPMIEAPAQVAEDYLAFRGRIAAGGAAAPR